MVQEERSDGELLGELQRVVEALGAVAMKVMASPLSIVKMLRPQERDHRLGPYSVTLQQMGAGEVWVPVSVQLEAPMVEASVALVNDEEASLFLRFPGVAETKGAIGRRPSLVKVLRLHMEAEEVHMGGHVDTLMERPFYQKLFMRALEEASEARDHHAGGSTAFFAPRRR